MGHQEHNILHCTQMLVKYNGFHLTAAIPHFIIMFTFLILHHSHNLQHNSL